MNGNEFRSRLRLAWEFLHNEIGIARSVSSLMSLKVDEGFNAIALDSAQSYKNIYITAISRSYYNFILSDFSIYQFSWSSNRSWRLAFLPNPWIAGVYEAATLVREWEALEALGAYDQEEVALLIGELPYYGSIPQIRFEYAPDQYRELAHPCAHLHIGRDTENRWALSKVLNPLTFVMMITKLYYVDSWSPNSQYYSGDAPGCFDTRLITELERSRRVHDFSPLEERSLHFSAR
jgi:hypothetical protein